jgi:chaperonin GroEL
MPRQLLFKDEARAALLRGVNVIPTRSRSPWAEVSNVVPDKKYGSPTITKDGVTVPRDRAWRPVREHGSPDGRRWPPRPPTWPGTGYHRHRARPRHHRTGLKNVTAAPTHGNSSGHRAGSGEGGRRAEADVEVHWDKKEIAQVATIASNNDKTIGNLIAEAMEKVGKDGVITVEEAKGVETALAWSRHAVDRGYLSPYMVTDPSAWKLSSITVLSSSTRRSSA